jgi:enoyl-CoA hydratase/carnithine racemase
MLLGERISAERLHDLGSVNRLVESGTALTQALDLAERINARAPNAMQSIKELINDAPTQSLHVHLTQERDHFVKNLHHANAWLGISAFLNKEKPIYK